MSEQERWLDIHLDTDKKIVIIKIAGASFMTFTNEAWCEMRSEIISCFVKSKFLSDELIRSINKDIVIKEKTIFDQPEEAK